jgi:hypothetical protein
MHPYYVVFYYFMWCTSCNSLCVLKTSAVREFIKLHYQSNISEEFKNMIWCYLHVQSLLFGRSEGFSLAEFLDESLVS